MAKHKPDHISQKDREAVESPPLDAAFIAGMERSARGLARIKDTLRNHLPKPE